MLGGNIWHFFIQTKKGKQKKLGLSNATLFGSIFTAISVSAIVGAVAYARIDSSGDYAKILI